MDLVKKIKLFITSSFIATSLLVNAQEKVIPYDSLKQFNYVLDEDIPKGVDRATFEKFCEYGINNSAAEKFFSTLYSGFKKDRFISFNPRKNKTPRLKMIPLTLKQKADSVADIILDSIAKVRDFDPDSITNSNYNSSCLRVPVDSIPNKPDKEVNLLFANEIISIPYYVPKSIVQIHEINHLRRDLYNIPINKKRDYILIEAISTLYDVIYMDEVFKRSLDIPIKSIVSYTILDTDKNILSLGDVANFYRKLEHEKGSLEKALLSEESDNFIKKYYSNAWHQK